MKKILIVEDNEMNMKLFYDILSFQKYSIDKAFLALDAFKMIKDNLYDLIILDVQLPDIDGFELIQKLNNEKIKYPKIIITSACAMDDDKLKAKKLGIKTYITKPIDINRFVETVKSELPK